MLPSSCVPRIVMALAALALSDCGSVQTLSSTAMPGQPIILFPNAPDRSGTTVMSSNPYAEVAGVNGRSLTISELAGSAPTDVMTVDVNGNVGISGSLSSVSSLAYKKDIRPFQADALSLLQQTQVVTFHYRGEPTEAQLHVGFIAEFTPPELSGARHDSFNLDNSVAVNIAATKKLNERLMRLSEEVADLRLELTLLRHQRWRAR